MKHIIRLVPVAAILFIMACNSQDANKTNINNADSSGTTKPEVVADKNYSGTWSVERYEFGSVSAMDKAKADEWLQGGLTIDNDGKIQLSNFVAMEKIVNAQTTCNIANVSQTDSVETKNYFDAGRDPLGKLNLEGQKVIVYKTTCKDHPLSSLVLTPLNELIVRWDGVFFVFTKVK